MAKLHDFDDAAARLWSVAASRLRIDIETVAPLAGAEREMEGAVVSRTVTIKLPAVVFAEASVALQCTTAAPIANTVAEAGVQLTGTLPSTVSAAEGA